MRKIKVLNSCSVTARLICTFIFRYIDSTILLLPRSKISCLESSSVLCLTWSETPKIGFLATRLIMHFSLVVLSNLFEKIDPFYRMLYI